MNLPNAIEWAEGMWPPIRVVTDENHKRISGFVAFSGLRILSRVVFSTVALKDDRNNVSRIFTVSCSEGISVITIQREKWWVCGHIFS